MGKPDTPDHAAIAKRALQKMLLANRHERDGDYDLAFRCARIAATLYATAYEIATGQYAEGDG